ncbi:hypothetical protein BJX65DRAFT_271261 [Aspergillus insuetus]
MPAIRLQLHSTEDTLRRTQHRLGWIGSISKSSPSPVFEVSSSRAARQISNVIASQHWTLPGPDFKSRVGNDGLCEQSLQWFQTSIETRRSALGAYNSSIPEVIRLFSESYVVGRTVTKKRLNLGFHLATRTNSRTLYMQKAPAQPARRKYKA